MHLVIVVEIVRVPRIVRFGSIRGIDDTNWYIESQKLQNRGLNRSIDCRIADSLAESYDSFCFRAHTSHMGQDGNKLKFWALCYFLHHIKVESRIGSIQLDRFWFSNNVVQKIWVLHSCGSWSSEQSFGFTHLWVSIEQNRASRALLGLVGRRSMQSCWSMVFVRLKKA